MKWKQEYALGIPELDNQHKALVALLTEFELAFDGKTHWNAVHPLIVRTKEAARFHFAVEESLMQIVGYPAFLPHRSEHRYVLRRFETLEHSVLRKGMKDELLPMLTSWLLHHIVESDKPFARYALGKREDLARTGTA